MSEYTLEDLLNQFFESKRAKNSRYSLRALSQYLEMEPSFVSKILRKKYKLNTRIIKHIAKKINLDQTCIDKCIKANNYILAGRDFADIDDQIYSEIARWETFVILRYLDIDPSLSSLLLSQKLNLPESEVSDIIKKLEHLELIKKQETGNYARLHERYLIRDGEMRSAINAKITKDYILKALESVEGNPVDERVHMTSLFSIKKSTYEIIKNKIHDFALDIGRCAQEDMGSEEQVMIINLNFFPVIKREEGSHEI